MLKLRLVRCRGVYLFASYCFLLGRAPFYIILLFAGTCTFLHHIAFYWGVYLSTSYCFLQGRVLFYIIPFSVAACTFLHHTVFCRGLYLFFLPRGRLQGHDNILPQRTTVPLRQLHCFSTERLTAASDVFCLRAGCRESCRPLIKSLLQGPLMVTFCPESTAKTG